MQPEEPQTLITGALGFVGRHLVKRMIENNEFPAIIVRDQSVIRARELFCEQVEIFTLGTLQGAAKELGINEVINLSGFYTFGESPAETSALIKSNIEFPAQILSIVAGLNPKLRWIQANTFMQHFSGSEFNPSCMYAATKQAMNCLLAFFEVKGAEVHHMVLPQIYGSNDTRNKLINHLVAAAITGNAASLSSGRQIMDLLHVDDVVDAILIVRSHDTGSKTQLTSSDVLTIRELIRLVEQISGRTITAIFDVHNDRDRDIYEPWIVAPAPKGWSQNTDLTDWIHAEFENISPK